MKSINDEEITALFYFVIRMSVPSYLYVQMLSEKQIFAVSISPFKTLAKESYALLQFRVNHTSPKEEQFANVFLEFRPKKKVVDFVWIKKEFSLKDLLEKETIQCYPSSSTFETETKQEETIYYDRIPLARDLRVLILSFLSGGAIRDKIPFLQEWKLAFDSFSFSLPRFIFVRMNVTWVANGEPWTVVCGISRTPIIKTNLQHDLPWKRHILFQGFVEEELLEGYPLNIKEVLCDANKLFGTPSMYSIRIDYSRFGFFSFSCNPKKTRRTT